MTARMPFLALLLLICCSSCLRKIGVEQAPKAPSSDAQRAFDIWPTPILGLNGLSFDAGSAWSASLLIDSKSWWSARLRYISEAETDREITDGFIFNPIHHLPARSAEVTSLLWGPRVETTHFFAALMAGPAYFNGRSFTGLDSIEKQSDFDFFGPTYYYHHSSERVAGIYPSFEISFGPRWQMLSLSLTYVQLFLPHSLPNGVQFGIELSPWGIYEKIRGN